MQSNIRNTLGRLSHLLQYTVPRDKDRISHFAPAFPSHLCFLLLPHFRGVGAKGSKIEDIEIASSSLLSTMITAVNVTETHSKQSQHDRNAPKNTPDPTETPSLAARDVVVPQLA